MNMLREAMHILERPFRLSHGSSPKRNRKVINKYLQRMGRKVNRDLSLDSNGSCCIPFRKFLVIVDVPGDDGGQCNIYTKVFDLRSNPFKKKVEHALNEMSTMLQLHTGGTTLGLEGEEVFLFFSTPIEYLRFKQMEEMMEDFLGNAVAINTTLDAVR
jgi:hypothetical protein